MNAARGILCFSQSQSLACSLRTQSRISHQLSTHIRLAIAIERKQIRN